MAEVDLQIADNDEMDPYATRAHRAVAKGDTIMLGLHLELVARQRGGRTFLARGQAQP